LILDQFSRVTRKEPTLHTRKLSFSCTGARPTRCPPSSLKRLAPSPTNRTAESCPPNKHPLSARQAVRVADLPAAHQAKGRQSLSRSTKRWPHPLSARQAARVADLLSARQAKSKQSLSRSTKHLGDLSPPTKRLRTSSHPSQTARSSPHQDRTIARSLTTFHPHCSPNN
jgi:hypothetical protein